jgi:hypothetical protein
MYSRGNPWLAFGQLHNGGLWYRYPVCGRFASVLWFRVELGLVSVSQIAFVSFSCFIGGFLVIMSSLLTALFMSLQGHMEIASHPTSALSWVCDFGQVP